MHVRRLCAPLLASCVAGAALVVTPLTSAADPVVDRDASAIVRWNEITERTILENGVPVPASSVYFGFAALAAYDAVVAIEGEYEPWIEQPRAHAHASSEVAAVTASYHVLRHYFPASAAALAEDHAEDVAGFRNGVSTVHGVRVGEAAAASLIARRTGDGRGAVVAPPGDGGTPGAGDWRPPASGMAVPWLGFVQPLVLPSATTFPLAGPDPLDSAAYAADFAEVRDYGRAAGPDTLRTADQTATALFWNANPVRQFNAAVRDQVVDRHLDIVDGAHAFAVHHSSTADALISCWRVKHATNFWRPVTAIVEADTDGNDATTALPGWAPLATTPPYPDYASGHACLTGATTGTLEHLFGPTLDPTFEVPSFGAPAARHFSSTGALDVEAMDARIWLGFHFRKAMTDGNALGHAVGSHHAANAFQPLD